MATPAPAIAKMAKLGWMKVSAQNAAMEIPRVELKASPKIPPASKAAVMLRVNQPSLLFLRPTLGAASCDAM